MAAQLLTPVCTDALKFHKPLLLTFSSRRYSSSLPNGSTSRSLIGRGRGRKRRDCGRIKVATEGSASTDAITDDYYAALGLVNFGPSVWFSRKCCVGKSVEDTSSQMFES